jgi:hypothetical protein
MQQAQHPWDLLCYAGTALLLQDIYIARAEGELQLEEELFYLLLKIYKTPKLLNELTRLSQQATYATA